jgi:hypothetical protein
MAVLIASICFEGVGRKYLPEVPAFAFYFLKDVVLLVGLLAFGVRRDVLAAAKRSYRGFGLFLGLSVLWTVGELANPAHASVLLGLVGLRSYWLWWLAPLVIASALRHEDDARRVFVLLSVVALVVAAVAVVQFQAPPGDDINRYALYRSSERTEVATVTATGRARVASTFSYLSGFADFVALVPALLLSLGLGEPHRRTRALCLAGAAASAIVMPMSGSRGPVVLGILAIVAVAWAARLFVTRLGRRVMVAAAAVVLAALVAFPEAVAGVRSRWEGDDTRQRFEWGLNFLPPVALAVVDYPALGMGTGMQHNAADALGARPGIVEGEYERFLVELGAPGFLLYWTARLGLLVAFLRAYRRLRERGRLAAAGASLAWAAVTMIGSSLVFDHTWQALYFLGGGLILREVTRLGPAPWGPIGAHSLVLPGRTP